MILTSFGNESLQHNTNRANFIERVKSNSYIKMKLDLELDSPCFLYKVITLTYILIFSDIFRCGRVHFRQPFL